MGKHHSSSAEVALAAFYSTDARAELPTQALSLIQSFSIDKRVRISEYNSLPALWQRYRTNKELEQVAIVLRIRQLYRSLLKLIDDLTPSAHLTIFGLRDKFLNRLDEFREQYNNFDSAQDTLSIEIINLLFYINKPLLKQVWHRAVRQGELSLAGALLGCGVNPELEHPISPKAVVIATEDGNDELLELLLFAGAKPDITYSTMASNQMTVLNTAIQLNHTSCIIALANAGANIETKHIELAIESNNIVAIRRLIKKYINAHQDFISKPTLINLLKHALRRRLWSVADLIITQFMQGVEQAQLQEIISEYLPSQRADAVLFVIKNQLSAVEQKQDDSGSWLMHTLIEHYQVLQFERGNNIFHYLGLQDEEVITLLITTFNQERLDKVNDNGETPLAAVIKTRANWLEIFKLFRNNGVDLTKCDAEGNNYLHLLVSTPYTRWGLGYGHHETELFDQARLQQEQLAMYLIENYPQLLNQMNGNGDTPLSLSIGKHRWRELLINNGGKIQANAEALQYRNMLKKLRQSSDSKAIEMVLREGHLAGCKFKDSDLQKHLKWRQSAPPVLWNYWKHNSNIFRPSDPQALFFCSICISGTLTVPAMISIAILAGQSLLSAAIGLSIAGAVLLGPIAIIYACEILIKAFTRLMSDNYFASRDPDEGPVPTVVRP